MNTEQQQYKVGDVANGHVLTDGPDGIHWVPVADGQPESAPVAAKVKSKHRGLKIGGVALAAVIGLAAISSAMNDDKDSTKPASATQELKDSPAVAAPAPAPSTEPPAATTPAAPAPTTPKAEPKTEKAETAGQKNARRTADNYLEMSAFSRKGLIEQLKFEGYSTKDATYAVDAIHPNWNEQAAIKAQSYLDMSGFSRSGLIDQLKFEGFTAKQAAYGVKKAGL